MPLPLKLTSTCTVILFGSSRSNRSTAGAQFKPFGESRPMQKTEPTISVAIRGE
jgi:hypothetical protein